MPPLLIFKLTHMARKKIIHINQHRIRSNKKHGTDDPVVTVKQGRKNNYCHEIEIECPSRVVYSPNKPLKCGARVWIETQAEVKLILRYAGRAVVAVSI
jgi:hypothetical protein